MGLLDGLNINDALKGVLGQVEAAALPVAINALLAKTQYHDLNGLVAALQKGGLNAQVQSWLGPGANIPITEDQPGDAPPLEGTPPTVSLTPP
jgi:uncharacterized protein YidB (DUF937 family)